jgi:hypothetical protein
MASNAVKGAGWSRSPWRLVVWAIPACILALPLIAMRFTSEVDWDARDFIIIGIILFIAFGTFDLAAKKTDDKAYRAGVAVAILSSFLLIWVNLAVGFLGDEGNPANLMFLGVLAVAIVGSFVARFRPAGMNKSMLAAAVTQSLVGVVGFTAGFASPGAAGIYEVVLGTGMFGALWLFSAWLFWNAADPA